MRLQQSDLRAFHSEHGIVTEAWSPLGKGQLLGDETIRGIASAHERTPAQVVLLTDDEMEAIHRLDAGQRTGPGPATFG
jgi:diketogulonate reductase-like aldo/keto reductase